ncbi:dihydrofolate reductase [Agromyces aerolatus]|uniref:dihydrofolate reductase n=1 Tax=Agromyces sp. LY-1074 TaxID=3074080 RepID=UPI002856357A|nr:MULTISPECIES: dihydrofolate reductase [unclassified Agromyces]MDR5701030.1 dihydrofolate reductase [Agromyces sp. LY-1074]MDR5707670.1 dihydrofolate reductase [Agromyces sp. LY-1358]
MTEGSHPPIGLVWAEARGGVIGAGGGMPWHVPEDLAHFKAVTIGAPVIMGRKTWDSLPERFRPLPGRPNLVVTRQPGWAAEGARRAGSLDEALASAAADRVWVIGGGELFRLALPLADRIERTVLDLEVDGDAFAPPLDETWHVVDADPAASWHTSRSGIRYRFERLAR